MSRWIAPLMLLSLAIGGCGGTVRPRPIYVGPTDPIDVVIADINRNSSKIPTLWATQNFEATMYDEKKESHFINGYGTLNYISPESIHLTANKEIGSIFDLGSNSETFWLNLAEKPPATYWGYVKNIGKPCVQPMPIRPDLILQVLGVSQINIDLTRDPVPVMRFNNDADAYMFVWQTRAADRWLAQKEIWYDRQTRRPSRIMLFDDKGRVVLRAFLSDYQQIEVEGAEKKEWPWMATQYKLLFPDSGSNMSFTLSDATLSHNGLPSATKSFRMPDMEKLREAGAKVIQIDEQCGP